MYSPRLYKYRDSCTVYTYSTRLRFTLLGTDTHTWRFRPLLSDCRLQSLDLSIKVHFKLQLLDLNLSSPNIFVTDGINLSYFKLNFFYRTEFKVWNISGLIDLFVKKKSLRQKKSLSGFEYQCFENAGFLFYTCVWCFMYACPRFNSIYLDMHLNLEIKTIWKSVKLNVKQFISIYWNTKILFFVPYVPLIRAHVISSILHFFNF